MTCEFKPRLDNGVHQQSAEHLIEQSNMIGVEIGPREEETADACEHRGQELGRTVLDSLFQFANEPGWCRHVPKAERSTANARKSAQTRQTRR
jgi:hypothetical protein